LQAAHGQHGLAEIVRAQRRPRFGTECPVAVRHLVRLDEHRDGIGAEVGL
jgi:hypothetical protein